MGSMGGCGVLALLLVGLGVLGVVWLSQELRRPRPTQPDDLTLEVLAPEYASGGLHRDQQLQRRADLTL